jgi:hypothetical protein
MQLARLSRDQFARIAAVTALALGASAQYTVGSPTGPFAVPSSGTGGTTLNMSWFGPILPQTVDLSRVPLSPPGVPPEALNVRSIKIYHLSHTSIGDLQVVLQDPSGLKYTLFARPGSDGLSPGNDGNLTNSDITIVDPGTPLALDVPTASTTDMPTGVYRQYFNPTWSSASQLAAVGNVNLSAIPMVPGQWKLTIYDWRNSNAGTYDRWEMSGDAPPAPYCTAGTSSHGCVPSIAAANNPSLTSANPCVITIANVEGQKSGMLFYGIDNTGFVATPWSVGSTSYQCVRGPQQRMNALSSGGTLDACDGSLIQDFNAFRLANPAALGNPFALGQEVFAQGWYRDPLAPKTTNLSNAIKMTFMP